MGFAVTEDQEFTLPPLEERPLVTFALFAYNQEKYIREAVEGAFAQTYEPLEILISDDCSTDETFQIIKKLTSEYNGPHLVKIEKNEKNIGKERFGQRISDVLKQCEGELIIIGSGDDISHPNRTALIYSKWHTAGRPKASIHSKVQATDENGKDLENPTGGNEIAYKPISDFIKSDGRGLIGAAHAIDKRLFTDFGPLPPKILIEDGALAFRARLSDGILFVEKTLVRYRRHESNLSTRRELSNETSFQQYILSLIGLHTSFICDYINQPKRTKEPIIKYITCRLRSIDKMRPLFSGRFLSRLIAISIYSRDLPLSRRLMLLTRAIYNKKRLSD